MLKWNINSADSEKVQKICKRAFDVVKASYPKREYLDLSMDIMAAHLNGNPLDLDKLINAPDFDFYHDVFGIISHLDRQTGELTDCFSPRCSARI